MGDENQNGLDFTAALFYPGRLFRWWRERRMQVTPLRERVAVEVEAMEP